MNPSPIGPKTPKPHASSLPMGGFGWGVGNLRAWDSGGCNPRPSIPSDPKTLNPESLAGFRAWGLGFDIESSAP